MAKIEIKKDASNKVRPAELDPGTLVNMDGLTHVVMEDYLGSDHGVSLVDPHSGVVVNVDRDAYMPPLRDQTIRITV